MTVRCRPGLGLGTRFKSRPPGAGEGATERGSHVVRPQLWPSLLGLRVPAVRS